MAEFIIDGNAEKQKDEDYKAISINAFRVMSEVLVEMEMAGMNEKEMMRFCVWPILEESRKRFEKVGSGEKTELDNFEKLFNKPPKKVE